MSKQKSNKSKPTKKKNESAYPSQKILEASIDGFCVVNLDGNFVEVNSALCNMTGYSKKELLEMKITDIEAVKSPEECAQHIKKVKKTGHDRFETKHRRKDSKIIDVEVSVQFYEDGQDQFIFCFHRDISERKQAERTLRASEKKFRDLVETTTDWVWEVDANGAFTYVSPKVKELLGYEVEDLLGKQPFDFMPGTESEKLSKFFSEQVGKKEPFYQLENIKRHKDGHFVIFETSGIPIFDKDGQFEGYRGINRDVTKHKSIEEKLTESEERYKTLFQSAAEGIIVADIETKKFNYANPAMCKILGYTEEELLQLGVNDIHPKEALPHVFSEFEAQARGEKILASLPCLRKDGTVIYADINAAAVIIDGRKCNVGFFTDITERKQVEEEIRKFRTIAEKANYGVAMSDLDGNLIYVNEYFAAIHGYTPKQLIGKNLTIFHNEEQLKQVIPLNEKLKKTGSINAVEVWHLHKCGTVFPMLMSSIIIKDENNNPRHMAATAIDITERKRLESEYEKYKEKILSIQRHIYISTLSSIVAHQINQPLTKISILLDRALETLNSSEHRCPSALNSVKEGLIEAKNIDSIIRKFREHSKSPTQQSAAKANINTVTNRIISMLSERALQAKMLISTKGLDNLPEIEINEIALEQIFLIIIQNAIEATNDGKKHNLQIVGKLLDGNIELQFTDNCCGISPENRDRIFEPFFSTKTDEGGLGLGLDILRQLLITGGGQVHVESQLGKGTTFYITLPITADLNT